MPDFLDDAPGTAMTGPTAPAAEPEPGDPQTPGQPAGSVTTAIPPECPTRTRLYRSGELLEEGFPAEQLSERLAADQDAVAWLDLYESTEADLQIVTEEFGLHPLAVEDAISPHQRPKVDRYRTHMFASMYAVFVSESGDTLAAGEVSVFITSRALITVRKDDFDIDALIARWDLNAGLVDSSNEVSCLTYGLGLLGRGVWARSQLQPGPATGLVVQFDSYRWGGLPGTGAETAAGSRLLGPAQRTATGGVTGTGDRPVICGDPLLRRSGSVKACRTISGGAGRCGVAAMTDLAIHS
ncbi:MAG: CorA family divalent cation transporter [Streptosporangiaceae bacterium]